MQYVNALTVPQYCNVQRFMSTNIELALRVSHAQFTLFGNFQCVYRPCRFVSICCGIYPPHHISRPILREHTTHHVDCIHTEDLFHGVLVAVQHHGGTARAVADVCDQRPSGRPDSRTTQQIPRRLSQRTFNAKATIVRWLNVSGYLQIAPCAPALNNQSITVSPQMPPPTPCE